MTRNQFSRFKNVTFTIYSKIPAFIKKPFLRSLNEKRLKNTKKIDSPSTLIFYVTNKCNARCKHCFYWRDLNKKEQELNLEQIRKIANSLKRKLDLLVITGGEPFLREDIVEICRIFYGGNNTNRISIDTNGTLPDVIGSKVRNILEANPSKTLSVFISLDGMEKTHDNIRGIKNAFNAVEKTLKKLKELEQKHKNLSIMVATTITGDNIDELEDIISFVKRFNVLHKFNILRTNATVFGIDKNLLNDFDPKEVYELTFDDLERVYNIISRNKGLGSRIEAMKIRHSIDMLKYKKRTVKCLATYNNAVVFPDGFVSFCEPVKPFANLKEFGYNIFDLLNSKQGLERKEKLNNCFCLQPCNLLDAMRYDTDTLIRL